MGPRPHASKPSIPMIEFHRVHPALNFATALMVIEKRKILKKKKSRKRKKKLSPSAIFFLLSITAHRGEDKDKYSQPESGQKARKMTPWTLVLHFIISCSPFILFRWMNWTPNTLYHSTTLHWLRWTGQTHKNKTKME